MRLVPAFAAFALVAATPAWAAEQPYSAAAFQAAQAAGKPIVVDVTASWCSTCQAQKPIVRALSRNPKYKNVVVFDVDFDREKGALRRLGAQQQSTIIVFKGQTERARSVGDTSKGAIKQLFDAAS